MPQQNYLCSYKKRRIVFWIIWFIANFLFSFRLKWIISLLFADPVDCNVGFCFLLFVPVFVAELYLVLFFIINILSLLFQRAHKYVLAYVMLAILLLPVAFDLYRNVLIILGLK
jgi:hypothetical protein